MPIQRRRTIAFNGIDGNSGRYLLEPLAVDAFAALVNNDRPSRPAPQPPTRTTPPRARRRRGLPFDLRPEDVASAGWAVVFHTAESAGVRKALKDLIDHRQRMIGDATRCRVLDYNDGEVMIDWLNRHGTTPGTVKPERVPYYLLLIGAPDRIPFTFGLDLDSEYAVGRLAFETELEYARYAASVIEYETATSVANLRQAVFFGTRHDFDEATQLSADYLVSPLANGQPNGGKPSIVTQMKFQSTLVPPGQATKAMLGALLGSAATPAPSLLFTATHGLGFPCGDSRQRAAQGALVCQDWPGLGQIAPEHYFESRNIDEEARLAGLVAVLFACYGAGTPKFDRYVHEEGQSPPQIAPAPFFASLPQRMLGGKSGALACVGHVERAWGCSIANPDAGPQLQPFENMIGRILRGDPLGMALKDINEKYAVCSVDLATTLERRDQGDKVDDWQLASKWLERNDAGNYLLFGDPATRLRPDKLQAASGAATSTNT